MIAALAISASAISGAFPAEEIDAEARFCLSLPARPDAIADLLRLRERSGWQPVGDVGSEWNGETYEVRTYQKGNHSVTAAFASKSEPAFCRYSVLAASESTEEAVDSVRKIYLDRAAVMSINPYEFATGVGESVEVEIVTQSNETTLLQFTISTSRKATPF